LEPSRYGQDKSTCTETQASLTEEAYARACSVAATAHTGGIQNCEARRANVVCAGTTWQVPQTGNSHDTAATERCDSARVTAVNTRKPYSVRQAPEAEEGYNVACADAVTARQVPQAGNSHDTAATVRRDMLQA
jgi:hypothetical protein